MVTRRRSASIGAGGSGWWPAQVLDAPGFPSTASRRGGQVGGNWRYENDNGMSSAYRSLHINTSRRVMAYKALPMPRTTRTTRTSSRWPVLRRLGRPLRAEGEDQLPHRGGRGRAADGEWAVTTRRGGRAGAGALPGGARRQRPPLGATLARTRLPRADGFEGEQIARPSLPRAGRAARASGCWSSASATPPSTSRSSPRGSPTKTFLAMRRGAYVLPKYINGKPIDERLEPDQLPAAAGRCSDSSRSAGCRSPRPAT